MELTLPTTATTPEEAHVTPSRIGRDFRTWLVNNQRLLGITDAQLEWYAGQMETAYEFGWHVKGHQRGNEFWFEWHHDSRDAKATGSMNACVYRAFLSSLEARRRYLRDGK